MKQKYSDIPVYTIVINPKPHKPYKPPIKPEPKEESVIANEVSESALRLEEARRITLTGDVAGATLFDGSDDVTLKVTVKNADRAIKDANGKDISKTYAKKSDLEKYASKDDVKEKLNYLETVLHATKEAVNKSLREEDLNFAAESDVEEMFGD